MVGLLETGVDAVSVELLGKVVDAGKEPVEEVHHVAVARGGDEILGIASGGSFDTHPVVDVVLEGQTRFKRRLVE